MADILAGVNKFPEFQRIRQLTESRRIEFREVDWHTGNLDQVLVPRILEFIRSLKETEVERVRCRPSKWYPIGPLGTV